jgi:hypothetical protein
MQYFEKYIMGMNRFEILADGIAKSHAQLAYQACMLGTPHPERTVAWPSRNP